MNDHKWRKPPIKKQIKKKDKTSLTPIELKNQYSLLRDDTDNTNSKIIEEMIEIHIEYNQTNGKDEKKENDKNGID